MKFKAPEEKMIFIELSRSDMERLGLDYCELDYNDERTRRVIYSVLGQAKYSLGQSFRLSDTRSVEALPRDDGGCFLLFTLREKKKRYRLDEGETEIYCEITTADGLLDLASSLDVRKNDLISSLFLYDKTYYLRLKGRITRSLLAVITEYAYLIRQSDMPQGDELRCIIDKNALDVLCGGVSER